ncbi:hypothetical protein ACJ41O_001374 [Fusarium nematophilum]
MKERVRVSESIHFPRHSYRASRRINGVGGYHDVLGRAVLISIVNYLADVADAVEDLKLPTQPEHRARLRMERKKMCDSVVKGANDLTALFDSVKGENKYTDLCPTDAPKTPPTMVVIDAELLVLELAEQMGDSDPVSDAEAEAEVEAEVGTVVLVDESVACGPS